DAGATRSAATRSRAPRRRLRPPAASRAHTFRRRSDLSARARPAVQPLAERPERVRRAMRHAPGRGTVQRLDRLVGRRAELDRRPARRDVARERIQLAVAAVLGGVQAHSNRIRFGVSRILITLAGRPATTAFAGTSFVTTEFVPMTALSPTVTPRRMHAP